MVWYILLGLIVLLIYVGVCEKFSQLADDKGHSKAAWFWTCFLLGIAGFCMVAALQDLTLHKKLDKLLGNTAEQNQKKRLFGNKTASPETAPTLVHADGSWICGLCKSENGAAYDHCRKCGRIK